MEVQDGFIVSIFNYCDRWCETCAFTSRCRVFADGARHEAERDSSFKELIDTPTHPQDIHEPPPWLAEMIEEMNKAAEQAVSMLPTATTDELTTALPEPHARISRQARDYAFRVHEWYSKQVDGIDQGVNHPLSIILWFSTLNAAKVYRALSGLVEFDGSREFPPDHEGSAKVALIGIERSRTAWQDLVSIARITREEAAPFLADLEDVSTSLEELIPRARLFVRPGFDEPDEVKMLDANEC